VFETIKKRLSYKISLTLAGVMLFLTLVVAVFIIRNQERMMEELTLDKAKVASTLGAKMYGTVLDEAIDNGVFTVSDAFDRQYESIKGYDWGSRPKYHTKYDFLTDKAMVVFQDKFLETKDFVFAVGVDVNGYLPTHNTKYQQPLTGDFNKDMASNRAKQFFKDTVGLAAAQNTTPGLLQVYKRDTGETMWDVSSPIYVKGKHWGAFRIAVSIERIESRKQALLWSLMGLFGFFVLLVIGTIYLLIQRAMKPVEMLSSAADKISMGEGLEVKIVPETVDEIGTLTKSIDRLRASMKSAMERLGE
jgi:methyl-accepting chemotaxis protein